MLQFVIQEFQTLIRVVEIILTPGTTRKVDEAVLTGVIISVPTTATITLTETVTAITHFRH